LLRPERNSETPTPPAWCSRQRGVAASTATSDDDAIVIDQTLCNEEFGTIDTIINIDDAPIAFRRVDEPPKCRRNVLMSDKMNLSLSSPFRKHIYRHRGPTDLREDQELG
jgi:hypothetical protein